MLHEEIKHAKPDYSEEYLKALREVAEQLDKKKNEPLPPPPKREKTELELFFNSMMIEYNEAHKQQFPSGQRGPRFIAYKDKKLSVEEYLNIRYNEEYK